jgi:hypothetical protein
LLETEISAAASSSDRPRELYISYSCALDYSYCGPDDGILFQPSKLEQKSADGSVRYGEANIVSILRQRIEELPESPKRSVLLSSRFSIPQAGEPKPTKENQNPYASCHPPQIVEEFYADLSSENAQDPQRPPKGKREPKDFEYDEARNYVAAK